MSKLRNIDKLFEGRHFDREVIVLCVRWYLRYKPSLCDLVEMMSERGLSVGWTATRRLTAQCAMKIDNCCPTTQRCDRRST